ncbi:hypothetical protein DV515_00005347, partial [Chloebia gouldiae]
KKTRLDLTWGRKKLLPPGSGFDSPTAKLLIVFLPVSPERVNRGAGFMEAGKESLRPKVFNLIGHRSFFVRSEKALS